MNRNFSILVSSVASGLIVATPIWIFDDLKTAVLTFFATTFFILFAWTWWLLREEQRNREEFFFHTITFHRTVNNELARADFETQDQANPIPELRALVDLYLDGEEQLKLKDQKIAEFEARLAETQKACTKLVEALLNFVITIWKIKNPDDSLDVTAGQERQVRRLAAKHAFRIIKVFEINLETSTAFQTLCSEFGLLEDTVDTLVTAGILKESEPICQFVEKKRAQLHSDKAAAEDTLPGTGSSVEATVDSTVDSETADPPTDPKAKLATNEPSTINHQTVLIEPLGQRFHAAWTFCSRWSGYNKTPWTYCSQQLDMAIVFRPESENAPPGTLTTSLAAIKKFVSNSTNDFVPQDWREIERQLAAAIAATSTTP